MRTHRVKTVAATAAAISMLVAQSAWADNLHLDSLTGDSSAATIAAHGAAVQVSYWIGANGSDGCNVDESNPATMLANAPAGVTATPSTLTFRDCGSDNAQSVSWTATTPGVYSSIQPSISGGRSDGNGWNSNPAILTLTVTKGVQTITFPQPTSPAPNGSTFNVNPTASSGLPVTLTPSGPCAVAAASNGWDVTMTADSGDCSLAASQAGNTTWNAATSVTRIVAATPATVANTAPTAPGTPTASVTPNAGAFTLSWTASTDADDDPVTYSLQRRRSDVSGFSDVATGLTANSHMFAGPAGLEGEGTFTYRVQASDGTDSSEWMTSSPVKVDRTAPSAPTASADRPAEYTGDADWWRGSVTVSFTSNGDPQLVDGTLGSGVDSSSVTAPVTYNATGTYTAIGTVKDLVGNESAAGTLTVRVDADNPTASLTCPTDHVVQEGTATASWSGNDVGSGLVGLASRTLTLDTYTVGLKTVTGDAPVDNVGNVGTAPTCNYRVVYSRTGILQPINADGSSSFKLNSTIPVKVKLTGASAGTSTAVITQGVSKLSNNVWGAEAEGTSTAAPHSGNQLRYDATNDQYIFNLATKPLGAGTFRLTLTFDDGTTTQVQFSIVK